MRLALFTLFVAFFSIFFVATPAFASETNGTIDSTYKYAWGENIGWLNFGCDNCHVSVSDNGISGDAWSRQYGWVNLNPTNSGVKNDGAGVLSGDAWGSNIGWIDFAGVTIDANGDFLGYATVKSDSSKINFNCADGNSCSAADFKVETDWRPASARHNNSGNTGGGYLPSPVVPPILPPAITAPIVAVASNIGATIQSIYNSILSFFQPPGQLGNVIVQIPKIAPMALNTKWNILPAQSIHTFVFAPLPTAISVLASKFPELSNTFKSVGVERFSDVAKLVGVNLRVPGLVEELNNTINSVGVENLSNINNINGVGLNVPGLSNINGTIPTNTPLGTGNIALIPGLPVAKFSLLEKQNLPSEFVFARTDNELVDLNVALSFNEEGQVTQKIESLPGNELKLVVKPIGPTKSVTGYIAYEAAAPKVTAMNNSISLASLLASPIFSMGGLVQNAPSSVPVEQKLILSSFLYTDPTHSGIYTADVAAPSAPGSYQIITLIDYVDPELGTREIAMTAVIDPEGYVYEKNGDKETRIPSAIVSLYYLNLATKQYELWPAQNYQQENPQITDISGTYSFLVPAGSYYLDVEAPGYSTYHGKVFVATEGGGIHQNVEMGSSQGFLSNFDWKTALLIVVLLLLVYNLFQNTLRNELLKFLKKNDGK